MNKSDAKRRTVRKKLLKLNNTVHWDPKEGDKVYLRNVYLAISPFPFDVRQVVLRFRGGLADGPALDACLVDIDRLVVAYLKLRGVKPPSRLCKLAKAKAPPACDFVVPKHFKASSGKRPTRQRQG